MESRRGRLWGLLLVLPAAAAWVTTLVWYTAYQEVYRALPGKANVRCPNCGWDSLRLAFTGLPADRVGFASFWCDHCRYGLHLSRVAVPDGVGIIPIDLPDDEHARLVPDYTLVQPGSAA